MNTTMQIRIDKRTKDAAQKAFKDMGMDLSSGVKIFLKEVAKEKTFPFIPSAKARKIRKEWDKEVAWALKHGKGYASTKEMFDDIVREAKLI